MEDSQKIFKLVSILLQYPEKEWKNNKELHEEISNLQDAGIKKRFLTFLTYLDNQSMNELWKNYVNIFDFNEKTTLYLTYIIFGDNRERGPAFVKLKQEFAEAGFMLEHDELPDYLPLILEFASIAPRENASKLFKIHRKAIDLLHVELEKMTSPYVNLLEICRATIDSYMKESKAS
ncbi:nitrate reductase molybdenum cofactor assembly chaperone [Chengkuizengella axinellae]|uniref:Nitrate reductase molybdenum cofactor assembly chaperone n=1 Tax=Chengkuizengella axinellae TaxID=3064388 RepID=A0ABT9J162_9BACL|nr:nitrate reductase molybdenum cofactor assembly chaperone [Chengkuizengella sp. 2205SS18-9]MDP5275315.1 nitrate reductase molybdenum cofactor assembly chaperone [Chengkuizengella sp. 2205SS18-9]